MRVIRVDKFIEEVDDLTWLVDGLLPDIGWTLFYGLRGIGKTTFAMQLCDALQRGVPFLGRATVQTNILYIQADSVTPEWRQMLLRISPEGNEGFTVVDVPSQCLSTPEYVARLVHYVQVFKPGFVVFDSLYRLTKESINSEKVQVAINTMLDICQGVPFLLVHHPPHSESRAAGHHSLGATCSNEWSLLKTKLKIEKGRLVSDKEVLLARDSEGLWAEYAPAAAQRSLFADLYTRDVV